MGGGEVEKYVQAWWRLYLLRMLQNKWKARRMFGPCKLLYHIYIISNCSNIYFSNILIKIIRISMENVMKYIPCGLVDNKFTLFQEMAWCL